MTSSMDFLAENNICGQTILKLVSRGNAIMAELLRLADFIPPVFRLASKEEKELYHFILPDFTFFNKPDYFDLGINTNPDVEEREEGFKETHLEIVTRFYKMFESIYRYITDLNRFLGDLEEGVFVQQTLEIVLFNEDGKQLLTEAVYLYGAMLLILDQKVEGPIRERMIVTYHRHATGNTSVSDTNIEDVCRLLRSTGYQQHPTVKRPPNYPENFFSRVPCSDTFIRMVIGRLRSDDIYNLIARYPNPEHRSTALASQAAMLYVILFFAPDILQTQQAQMREIVDKHFPDNWVISLYMGSTVNLIDAWEPYKAARTALNNTLDPMNIDGLVVRHSKKVKSLNNTVLGYLREGTLTDDYVLDHIPNLMNTIRECNVTIRWYIVHTAPTAEHHKKAKGIRDGILLTFDSQALFQLLLNTSQYEFLLKEMFNRLMKEKQTKWEGYQKEGVERMIELADVFSGTKPLTRVEKNDHLQGWFREMSNQIGSLSYEDFTSAGRKIMQLHQALEEVLEFHGLENNMQVKQFLADTRQYLIQMLRTINVREEVLITLQQVADLSYAWILIDSYTPNMQKGIQKDPRLVIKLRATFLKLASGMELPLTRINEAKSKDLESVSAYYSQELVAYVRKVLQIIPHTMFELLDQIIEIQTSQMAETPMKLLKEDMKRYAQLDLRRRVAELTNKIAIFTEGMLLMKTTLVGVIKVDPKRLLEDGIRKELVFQVSKCLHEGLIFNPRAKATELEAKLGALKSRMNGFRRSFEYIQDYVSIYGLKIWQEEVSRIINYNVEQECNSFLKTKVEDWQSVYQSRTIPIPKFMPVGDGSVTFIGRLAYEIQRITDPKNTIYVDATNAWYDNKTAQEVANLNVWLQLQEAVDIFGLTALDRLFCFKIVRELQYFLRAMKRLNGKPDQKSPFRKILDDFAKEVMSPPVLIADARKLYSSFTNKLQKCFEPTIRCVMIIGQIQLIRRQITRELGTASKYDSKLLYNTLQTFNQTLLAEVRAHYRDPTKTFPGGEDSSLLYDITPYLESTGISDPLTKIYVTTTSAHSYGISCVIFLFIISYLNKLSYSKKVDTLIKKPKVLEALDGAPFVVGTLTLLRQFHADNTTECLKLLGQYIRSMMQSGPANPKERSLDLPPEVVNSLFFMEEYSHFAHLPRKDAEQYVPSYLLDEFRHYLT